jgi:hypothetical protein
LAGVFVPFAKVALILAVEAITTSGTKALLQLTVFEFGQNSHAFISWVKVKAGLRLFIIDRVKVGTVGLAVQQNIRVIAYFCQI